MIEAVKPIIPVADKPKGKIGAFFEEMIGSRNKFVVNIGDEGSVISYFKGKAIDSRIFANITHAEDQEKIKEFLSKDTAATIYLLSDVLEQNYGKHSFPPVNAFTIGSLVKNKLNRDYADNLLKNSYFVEKTISEKPTWEYMFVISPIIPPLSTWMDFVATIPNQFGGIYMLPLEATKLVDRLNKASFATKNKDNTKSHCDWQILTLHNKSSGYRQIALFKGKVMFTRLLSDSGETNPEILAGNIDQEIHNTIEYLRRMTSSKEDQEFDIYVICSQDIKKSLATIKLPGKFISILSPHEVASKLHFANVSKPEDKFADTISQASFLNSGGILSFTTGDLSLLMILQKVVSKMPGLNLFLILAIIWVIISGYWDIKDTLSIIQKNTVSKADLTAQLSKFDDKEMNIDGDKILEIAAIYKTLSVNTNLSPFTAFNLLVSAKTDKVNIKTIDWSLIEDKSPQNINATEPTSKDSITMRVDADYVDEAAGYKELWDNYNQFVDDLTKAFDGYNVKVNRTNDRITFSQEEKNIPITIDITGPNAGSTVTTPTGSAPPTSILQSAPMGAPSMGAGSTPGESAMPDSGNEVQ